VKRCLSRSPRQADSIIAPVVSVGFRMKISRIECQAERISRIRSGGERTGWPPSGIAAQVSVCLPVGARAYSCRKTNDTDNIRQSPGEPIVWQVLTLAGVPTRHNSSRKPADAGQQPLRQGGPGDDESRTTSRDLSNLSDSPRSPDQFKYNRRHPVGLNPDGDAKRSVSERHPDRYLSGVMAPGDIAIQQEGPSRIPGPYKSPAVKIISAPALCPDGGQISWRNRCGHCRSRPSRPRYDKGTATPEYLAFRTFQCPFASCFWSSLLILLCRKLFCSAVQVVFLCLTNFLN